MISAETSVDPEARGGGGRDDGLPAHVGPVRVREDFTEAADDDGGRGLPVKVQQTKSLTWRLVTITLTAAAAGDYLYHELRPEGSR